MTEKPEVHLVIVEIELPSPRCPGGRSTRGHYIVTNGTVILTDPQGEPAADMSGKTYEHKLAPNDDAHQIAGRLTKQLYNALRGSSRPRGFGGGSSGGFNRQLNYS